MHDLVPVLAATVFPAALILAVAYPLRPQFGRHSAGTLVKRAAGWSPYDARTRRAIAHYAGKEREPQQSVAPAAYQTAERDLTGAFPVAAVA